MALHSNAPIGDRHPVHNYSYASAALRNAATGFVSADVGKIALQTADYSFWVLSATTPTWTALAGAAPPVPPYNTFTAVQTFVLFNGA